VKKSSSSRSRINLYPFQAEIRYLAKLYGSTGQKIKSTNVEQ